MSLLQGVLPFVQQLGPSWGWLIAFCWLTWQLYCPLPSHTTKLQAWHDDLTRRFARVEKGQAALAEEVSGVDAERLREVHGHGTLQAEDFKTDSNTTTSAED